MHIPKTGGNSVSQALLPFTESNFEAAPSPQGIKSGENFWPTDRDLGRDKHNTADWYADHLDYRDYYFFTTVRNPWDRMVSYYFFCKQLASNESPGWVTHAPEIFSKDEFLEFLESRHPTQTSFLGTGLVHVDVMRFENLTADFERVCKKLGLENLSLGKINSSRRPRYQDILDRDLELRIGKMYAEDIERFGYKFAPGYPVSFARIGRMLQGFSRRLGLSRMESRSRDQE